MSGAGTQRLDKWLWCARFFKSRGLANRMLGAGRLRLGGNPVGKAHQLVRAGDVLTFPQGSHIRVVRVLFLAERRGPAPEARTLYEDLVPLEQAGAGPAGTTALAEKRAGAGNTDNVTSVAPLRRDPGSGRPTKRDRRVLDRLRAGDE